MCHQSFDWTWFIYLWIYKTHQSEGCMENGSKMLKDGHKACTIKLNNANLTKKLVISLDDTCSLGVNEVFSVIQSVYKLSIFCIWVSFMTVKWNVVWLLSSRGHCLTAKARSSVIYHTGLGQRIVRSKRRSFSFPSFYVKSDMFQWCFQNQIRKESSDHSCQN